MSLQLHSLAGTDLQLSTFCYGCAGLFQHPVEEAEKVLDAFVEAGGNFFDTAHCYSFWMPRCDGLSETSLGDYVRRRGLKDVVIATKGGHPSAPGYRKVEHYLSAARVSADIDDSLARLGRDRIDLYYLHRDDPRVGVGEIVEMLNAEIHRGRIRYPAVSNWSVARLAEANAYARAKNLQPFVLSQPRWSLADMKIEAMGEDTRDSAMTETTIAWYRENQFAVAAYSPLGGGFFSGTTDAAFDTAANHQRRARATELAKKHGATPIQIAVAWLRHQAFPVFPVLGSSKPERIKEGLAADAIRLTAQEVEWLGG